MLKFKFVPRKVIYTPFRMNEVQLMGWNCPRCEQYLGTYNVGYRYCPNCGQRLSWEPVKRREEQ